MSLSPSSGSEPRSGSVSGSVSKPGSALGLGLGLGSHSASSPSLTLSLSNASTVSASTSNSTSTRADGESRHGPDEGWSVVPAASEKKSKQKSKQKKQPANNGKRSRRGSVSGSGSNPSAMNGRRKSHPTLLMSTAPTTTTPSGVESRSTSRHSSRRSSLSTTSNTDFASFRKGAHRHGGVGSSDIVSDWRANASTTTTHGTSTTTQSADNTNAAQLPPLSPPKQQPKKQGKAGAGGKKGKSKRNSPHTLPRAVTPPSPLPSSHPHAVQHAVGHSRFALGPVDFPHTNFRRIEWAQQRRAQVAAAASPANESRLDHSISVQPSAASTRTPSPTSMLAVCMSVAPSTAPSPEPGASADTDTDTDTDAVLVSTPSSPSSTEFEQEGEGESEFVAQQQHVSGRMVEGLDEELVRITAQRLMVDVEGDREGEGEGTLKVTTADAHPHPHRVSTPGAAQLSAAEKPTGVITPKKRLTVASADASLVETDTDTDTDADIDMSKGTSDLLSAPSVASHACIAALFFVLLLIIAFPSVRIAMLPVASLLMAACFILNHPSAQRFLPPFMRHLHLSLHASFPTPLPAVPCPGDMPSDTDAHMAMHATPALGTTQPEVHACDGRKHAGINAIPISITSSGTNHSNGCFDAEQLALLSRKPRSNSITNTNTERRMSMSSVASRSRSNSLNSPTQPMKAAAAARKKMMKQTA